MLFRSRTTAAVRRPFGAGPYRQFYILGATRANCIAIVHHAAYGLFFGVHIKAIKFLSHAFRKPRQQLRQRRQLQLALALVPSCQTATLAVNLQLLPHPAPEP